MTAFVGDGLATDTGVVFTGSNTGWTEVAMSLDCMSVLFEEHTDRGGGSPVPRYRFVFQGDENASARDGWMIDDVRVASRVCLGGIEERTVAGLMVSPVPSSEHITLKWEFMAQGANTYEIFDACGTVVRHSAGSAGVSQGLDVGDLSPEHMPCASGSATAMQPQGSVYNAEESDAGTRSWLMQLKPTAPDLRTFAPWSPRILA